MHASSELKALPENPDILIPASKISEYLPIARQTFSRWRYEGKGPRYLSIGGKRIAYRVGDLRDFLVGCSRSSTSERSEGQR